MKAKFITLLVLLSFLASSCDLAEEPYGFYSESNFYKTPEDAESSLMYAYNALTFIEYSRGIFYVGELASETCDVKPDEGYGAQQLNNWTADSSNEILTMYFKYCYIAINRANAVIQNVKDAEFDQSTKNRILGEAYFLRGYNYYNLVKVFGLVSIQRNVVQSISQASPFMARDMDELYNFIISDLKEAENLLNINQRVGRADKVAVQALLAKVYLTIASSKESGLEKYKDMAIDVNQAYAYASTYSHKVLYDQSQYKLDGNLQHIYDIEVPNGSEHIFIMSQDRTGLNEGNYSKIGMMFHPWVDGVPFYIQNSNNTFTYATNGWEVFQTTDAFFKTYDNADKRKTELLVSTVYNENKEVVASVGGKFKYPFTRKYVDPKFIGQKSSAKPYLIRFSDVALIYAEAQGPTAEGYTWVNKIRNRAGLGNLAPNLTSDAFRNAVVQERAWELAFEGHRLYDLRRKAIVTQKDPRAVAAGITEAKAAFYPIPQVEIDLNTNLNP